MTSNKPAKAAAKAASVEDNVKQYSKLIKKIQKRDGSFVPFEFDKIVSAIHRAMLDEQEGSLEEATMVAHQVAGDLVRIARKHKGFVATVEAVQDEVERQLILADYTATAKGYILYRAERAKEREAPKRDVPEHVKKLVEESAQYFQDNKFGEFVFLRTYARWIPEEGRRETWIETVDRYMDLMHEKLGDKLTAKEYKEVRESILKQEALPSMRLLQFAGPAVRRCNAVAFNCSYLAPSKLEDFAEAMYLSMSGVGVGFSVESYNVQKLPVIARQESVKKEVHVIPDSKEGWCDAFTLGLKTWYAGEDVEFDFSQLRPAGARLKTMGGKSSGPGPLKELLAFARAKILARQNKRLTNIDVHDIMCKIAEIVVAGGVRRSAMISLSDLDDDAMRDAKQGQFYTTQPQRAMANNSAVYEEKPTAQEFLDEWTALVGSGSGERGIFNRGGLKKTLPERRIAYLREKYGNGNGYIGPLGTNPCGEVILQPKGFCNLTEVVARSDDDEKSLLRKVRIAAILGTYQSTLTDYKYLSAEWKKNQDDERLLGVSLTGQWDSKAARDPKMLEKLRKESIKINKKYAERFGVAQSLAVTSVKPSGTASSVVNSASGMHARYAPYYLRRVRITGTDSLFKMLKDQGIPYFPEVGQSAETAHTWVLEFPVAAPKGSVYSRDLSAVDQLEHWKNVKVNYTEHNPSVTISVGDDEWIAVADWVYQNWEIVGGLSFLPRNDHVYQLAPYEEISKEEYERRAKVMGKIDFSKLSLYELKDETDVKKELACAGGTCEIEL